MVARHSPRAHVGDVQRFARAINPILYASALKVDLAKALTGVVQVSSIPDIIVARPDFPANNAKELVGLRPAHPGKLNFRIRWVAIRTSNAGVERPHGHAARDVPSKVRACRHVDTRGEIHFSSLNSRPSRRTYKPGASKALATVASRRLPALPVRVPTLAESGYPGIGMVNWNGLVRADRNAETGYRQAARGYGEARGKPEPPSGARQSAGARHAEQIAGGFSAVREAGARSQRAHHPGKQHHARVPLSAKRGRFTSV